MSPINAHTRAFIKALQLELDAHGPGAADLLGQPQLAPAVAGHRRADGARRRQARARVRHEHVQLLQRLPPLSRGSVRGHAQRAERAALRQAARAVQPSGLHRSGERLRRRGARQTAGRAARERARAVHGAQPAAVDGARLRVRAAARGELRARRPMRSSYRAGGSSIRATTLRTAASPGSGPTFATPCARPMPRTSSMSS